MIKFILFLFILSCSTQKLNLKNPNSDEMINTEYFYDLIPDKVKLIQYVEYQDQKRDESAQVIIVKDKEMKISVLSQMGIEILSIVITRSELIKTSSLPGFKIDFFYRVMADMLAVYAQKKLLLKSAREKIEIRDIELKREISDSLGMIYLITYSMRDRFKAEVNLEEKRYHYKLKIKTLKYENLH